MRIFKNTWFTRFASKNGISDEELKALLKILEAGAAVELGGDVYKQRLARPGEGKSGGYWIIVFFKSGDRTFYHYGFAKSARGNISGKELKAHKETARELFALTDEQIKIRLRNGTLHELIEEDV